MPDILSTLEDIVNRGAPQLGGVREWLESQREALLDLKEQYPDFGPAVDKALAALDAQVLPTLDLAGTAENLVKLPVTVLTELAGLREGLKPLWKPHSTTGG